MRRLVRAMFMLMAGAVFADTLHAAIEIRSDYPGGNVKVLGIDETSGVEFGALCKSQSGKRDTEMLRIRCRKEAKWLFAFTARHWVQDRPNCWLSVCCEFGYSLCGGVYSQDGGRELGHNLLKAAVRTVN